MNRVSSEAGQPSNPGPDTDWQVLGEFELPFGENAHSMIDAWLSEALAPLHLHVSFQDKVLRSAASAAAHAMQTETGIKHQHTHLLVYIPISRPANVRTWGFFRIDKLEPAAEKQGSSDHSIELYLYLEGQ
jgi:hypothetical protein